MPSAVDAVELDESKQKDRMDRLWDLAVETAQKRDEEEKQKKTLSPVDARIAELSKPLFEGVTDLHHVITKTNPRFEHAQTLKISRIAKKIEILSDGTRNSSHLTKTMGAMLSEMDKKNLEKVKIDQDLKGLIDALNLSELEKFVDEKDLAQVKKMLGSLDLSLGAEISRTDLKKLDSAISTLVDTLKSKTSITTTTELQRAIHNLQAFQEILKNIAKRHDELMRTIIGNSGAR